MFLPVCRLFLHGSVFLGAVLCFCAGAETQAADEVLLFGSSDYVHKNQLLARPLTDLSFKDGIGTAILPFSTEESLHMEGGATVPDIYGAWLLQINEVSEAAPGVTFTDGGRFANETEIQNENLDFIKIAVSTTQPASGPNSYTGRAMAFFVAPIPIAQVDSIAFQVRHSFFIQEKSGEVEHRLFVRDSKSGDWMISEVIGTQAAFETSKEYDIPLDFIQWAKINMETFEVGIFDSPPPGEVDFLGFFTGSPQALQGETVDRKTNTTQPFFSFTLASLRYTPR